MSNTSMYNCSNSTEVEVFNSNLYTNQFSKINGVDDIDPKSYPVCSSKQLSETEYALSILHKHGFKSKIFCHAKVQNYISAFDVRSNKWNWRVMPIDQNNLFMIPRNLLSGVGILIEERIIIREYAFAKIQPVEAPSAVIKQEFLYEVNIIQNIIKGIISIIGTILTESTSVVFNCLKSNEKVWKFLSDPVLLVLIEDNWVEIGRWE